MANRLLRHVENLLRPDPAQPVHTQIRNSLLAVVCGGACYGAVMGGFGGLIGDRWIQITFSALKVPLLVMTTTLLTLPSFFVLNSLAGLRDDFGAVLRAVVSTQGTVAIVLASLAPYTAVWYLSTTNYQEAVLFNGVMFAVASAAAQWVLRQRYAPFIARNPRHRLMLRSWLVVYCFVGVQMGWILRPFVGKPNDPPAFFREDTWGNAYVIVVELLWKQLAK